MNKGPHYRARDLELQRQQQAAKKKRPIFETILIIVIVVLVVVLIGLLAPRVLSIINNHSTPTTTVHGTIQTVAPTPTATPKTTKPKAATPTATPTKTSQLMAPAYSAMMAVEFVIPHKGLVDRHRSPCRL